MNIKNMAIAAFLAWCVGVVIVASGAFWLIIGILWVLEFNAIVPPGTSAGLADYYPFVGPNSWASPAN